MSNARKLDLNTRHVMMLSFLSNVASSHTGKQAKLEHDAKKDIEDLLLRNEVVEKFMLAKWPIIWGPGVYLEKVPFESLLAKLPQAEKEGAPDHMSFVAKKPDAAKQDSEKNEDTYVISVAGTDGIASLFDDWLSHNLNFAFVTWPFGKTFDPEIKISSGALSGLDHTLSTTSTLSDNTTLLEFLEKEIAASNKQTIHLHTCGHSMGGALAPALAIYLFDEQRRWNLKNKKVIIHCLSVAGYSIGNQKFAERFTAENPGMTFDSNKIYMQRVYNPLDVVPHIWVTKNIAEILFMYQEVDAITPLAHTVLNSPFKLPPELQQLLENVLKGGQHRLDAIDGLKKFLKSLFDELIQLDTTHITEGIVQIDAPFDLAQSPEKNTPIDRFVGQILYQHTLGYVKGFFGGKTYPQDPDKLREQFDALLEALGFKSKKKQQKMTALFSTAIETVLTAAWRVLK